MGIINISLVKAAVCASGLTQLPPLGPGEVSTVLESEVQFAAKQADSEQRATLDKLESESLFEQKKADVERKSTIGKKAAERLQKMEADIEDEMMEWLGRNRLLRHAKTFARVAGGYD